MLNVSTDKRNGIVIVGLGSPIRTDDAIGLVIARRLGDLCLRSDCHIKELMTGGIQLVEEILGFDTAIIIDAMHCTDGAVGTCHRFEIGDLGVRIPCLTHHFGLMEGIELGKRLQLDIPGELRVYGIEVSDPYTVSEHMTPELTRSIPRILDYISSRESEIFDHIEEIP